jgi:hypothetical protein
MLKRTLPRHLFLPCIECGGGARLRVDAARLCHRERRRLVRIRQLAERHRLVSRMQPHIRRGAVHRLQRRRRGRVHCVRRVLPASRLPTVRVRATSSRRDGPTVRVRATSSRRDGPTVRVRATSSRRGGPSAHRHHGAARTIDIDCCGAVVRRSNSDTNATRAPWRTNRLLRPP